MAAVAAGDRSAFQCLVERHHRACWAVALRYTGNNADAGDLVQDTFLALFQKAARYKPRGRFRSYLLCALVNRAISYQRKRQPIAVESLETPAPGPDGEASLARAQTRARVAALLARLPERQRMAIILRFYQELSYAEIAQALSVSPKAVERLLHRARASLRELMERQA